MVLLRVPGALPVASNGRIHAAAAHWIQFCDSGGVLFLACHSPNGGDRSLIPAIHPSVVFEFKAHAYRALLSRCLRYPKTVFTLALCCMGMTWVLAQQRVRIAAGSEQNEFTMEVALLGMPLEETVGLLQAMERSLLEQKEALEIETSWYVWF